MVSRVAYAHPMNDSDGVEFVVRAPRGEVVVLLELGANGSAMSVSLMPSQAMELSHLLAAAVQAQAPRLGRSV